MNKVVVLGFAAVRQQVLFSVRDTYTSPLSNHYDFAMSLQGAKDLVANLQDIIKKLEELS